MDGIPVGITGMYLLNMYDENVEDNDDVWLGWYGVLPEFRSRGIGKQSLLDIMDMAKRFGRKYFRLYTNNDINSTAYPLYEKVMQTREVYENLDYDRDCSKKYLIYSSSLTSDDCALWNNRCAYVSKDCDMCFVSNEKLKNNYKILFKCDINSSKFLNYVMIATLFRNDGHLVYFYDDRGIDFDIVIDSFELEKLINYDYSKLKKYKENLFNKANF